MVNDIDDLSGDQEGNNGDEKIQPHGPHPTATFNVAPGTGLTAAQIRKPTSGSTVPPQVVITANDGNDANGLENTFTLELDFNMDITDASSNTEVGDQDRSNNQY